MTAILKEAPEDLSASRASISPALARVVDRCLEKHPSARFQSASDLAFALQTLGTPSGSGSWIAATGGARKRHAWAWAAGAAVVSLAALGFFAWQSLGQRVVGGSPMAMLDVAVPAGHRLGQHVALSTDGSFLAFVAARATSPERGQLWLRDLSSAEVRELPDTAGAAQPFWSPDGRSIAFFSGGRLRAVDLRDGKVRVICEASGRTSGTGTWNQFGEIVFSADMDVLHRVKADGRTPPIPLVALIGYRPFFLPDGRHFLFSRGATGSVGISVADLETNESVRLVPQGSEAKYADGRLLFVQDEQLVAAAFDPERRRLNGTPVAISEFRGHGSSFGSNFSVAGGRLLAFPNRPPSARQLVWRARDGRRLGVVEGNGDWMNPELSPDETQVAVQRDEGQGTQFDIWIHDVARGASRSVASARGAETAPFWSADGSRILFRHNGTGLKTVALAGAPPAFKKGWEEKGGLAYGLAPDGRTLVGFRIGPQGNHDLFVAPSMIPAALTLSLSRPSPRHNRRSHPTVRGWPMSRMSRVGAMRGMSSSSRSRRAGMHVTTGSNGGGQPRWRRDGRELYFIGTDRRLNVVSVEPAPGGTLRVGTPQPLFEVAVRFETGMGTRAAYDVTRDGRRFVVAEDTGGPAEEHGAITVLVDWVTKSAKR